MRTVVGLSVKVSGEMYADEALRRMVEDNAVAAFTATHGFEPTPERQWYHEEAYTFIDPDTGEIYDIGERWVLLVEGVRP